MLISERLFGDTENLMYLKSKYEFIALENSIG